MNSSGRAAAAAEDSELSADGVSPFALVGRCRLNPVETVFRLPGFTT